MSAWKSATPLVFIIAPPRDDTDPVQDQARVAVQRWVEQQGWECRTRRAVRFRIQNGGNTGRLMQVMEPHDADDLYRAIHRRPTAVVQVGGPAVRLDPSAAPSGRNSASLARFIRYKAFFRQLGRVSEGFDPVDLLHGFREWITDSACDGERDARCIPLHSFSPSREWDGLDNSDGISKFEARHGRPASRKDDQGRVWKSPNALHGRDSVVVAGVALRAGFHWDVVSPQSSGRLCTSSEVWGFTPDAYCNVYPDGVVRQGQRRGKRARRVYVAARPDDTLKAEDVPASGARRRSKRR